MAVLLLENGIDTTIRNSQGEYGAGARSRCRVGLYDMAVWTCELDFLNGYWGTGLLVAE